MIRKSFYQLTFMLLLLTTRFTGALSQDIPARPVPPRLVNDFAGMLKPDQVFKLEQKLVAFNDSTSTQIAIVTVSTLGGYEKADYAQQLAEKWGIGQKGRNNGVLILVKPKTVDSRGEVQISTGYGVEGVIPDILSGEIIDREILPSFRNGDYYGGLDKATSTMMALARKEFSASDYVAKARQNSEKGAPLGLIILIIIIVIAVASKGSGGSNKRHISTGGLPFWMLLGMMNSGKGSGGSWGGFSGGGGSGGFGGFGGGSFGGGGAGGSW